MKTLLNLALIASICLASCSKKTNDPKPVAADVVEYNFKAIESGPEYVVNFFDGTTGVAQNVYTNTWTTKINLPTGTKTANLFFTGGQAPPYTGVNKGWVTIKLNGKVVATDTTVFTSNITLAKATYIYSGN